MREKLFEIKNPDKPEPTEELTHATRVLKYVGESGDLSVVLTMYKSFNRFWGVLVSRFVMPTVCTRWRA